MSLTNKNAEAIVILCSHLCVGTGVKPYEPAEWGRLAQRLQASNIQPFELLAFTPEDFEKRLLFDRPETERAERLIARSGSIAFEIDKYENMGIQIITRADSGYPPKLKKKLGQNCPPLFYYSGSLDLVNQRLLGFVGSRTIGSEDLHFTTEMVKKAISRGYGTVSGGAQGVDSVSTAEALKLGAFSVEYIPDSLQKRLRNSDTISAVRDGHLLILSSTSPNAGFNVGFAMMRNRFIYASSEGTVVVKSDLNKGGTWSGATDNLHYRWCPEFCWNNPAYPGNIELIEQGARPIDSDWTCEFESATESPPENDTAGEQISLFDS